MRVGRSKKECVVVATPAATQHARHIFPTKLYSQMYIPIMNSTSVRQFLAALMLLLAGRYRKEQMLDAAIVSIVDNFLPS